MDRSSCLSLYSPDYFFLTYENRKTEMQEMRFHLPPEMDAKLKELLAIARSPEEQAAMAAEKAQEIQAAMAQIEQDRVCLSPVPLNTVLI